MARAPVYHSPSIARGAIDISYETIRDGAVLRITANQVTAARLLLLPIPVAMIYRQETTWLLGALVLFVLLGLTDAVDGILARRHGATPLGALLDPVVDKVFLVACLGPLADLRIVSPALVVVLFIRELAVTALRSIALEESFTFRTSRIAKLKTTVQMAGAGFIFLVHLFPSDRVIWWILGVIAFASWSPLLLQLARRQSPDWRAVSGPILITLVFISRLFLSPQGAILTYMITIAGFTVVSGAEYFWRMRHVLARRFRLRPVEALRLAAVSLTVPLFYLPIMQRDGAPIYAILLILAFELVAGGLDNSLVQAGQARGPAGDLIRAGVQAACGIGMLWGLSSPGRLVEVHVFANIALLVTVLDVVLRFRKHHRVILDDTPAAPAAPASANPSGPA